MKKISILLFVATICTITLSAQEADISTQIDKKQFDPATLMWYEAPADNWDGALPVGNGRLGAMVYGNYATETIQLNEDTYWSGGPYSSVVKGGAEALPEIQSLIFNGEPIKAHKLFGRKLMGSPVEQQKFQPLANLILMFENEDKESVSNYKRWLDLSTGITTVEYKVDGVTYKREVLSSAPDQVILVRLSADKPSSISFKAQLRGVRNMSHSNYGTAYFRVDTKGDNGLVVNGKSTDYLGVEGKLKHKTELKALNRGGKVRTENDFLYVEAADEVTLVIAAATNFINYKDVSGDQVARVEEYLNQVEGKSYSEMKLAAVNDYKEYFDRVRLTLQTTEQSFKPTDKRIAENIDSSDPNVAALCYNFGRYALIASSREGTQPANLQGIWNDKANPAWDSKYTTNINTEMNYWHAESGNLPEMVEPLISMVKDLTDQGSQVAKEHYGAKGWVFHQNTDLWRVAAPMDGPCWGTFTVGGAWLTNQLYEHYLFNMDKEFLQELYPVMKGSVEFFMDFLIDDPKGKYLVTNPSTSPENPPKGKGYEYFFDEVTGFWYFTTICYGSTMDIQILTDLFGYYLETEKALGLSSEFASKVAAARKRFAPPQIGRDGTLQEWTEDFEQLEEKHRHFSHMYGLYPGNVISAKRTPEFIDGCKAVLNQRGDGTTGFSRAWKMALWARMFDGNRANKIFKLYLKEQCNLQFFSMCGKPLQIDGTMGTAAAITEMLVQSHEGTIDLLPALPDEWSDGEFDGVCARGAFELDMKWSNCEITEVELLSKCGNVCKIDSGVKFKVTKEGKRVSVKKSKDGSIEFKTEKGGVYMLVKN